MESPFMIVVHLENQLKRKAVEWEDTGMAFACELVDFVYLKEVSSYNLLVQLDFPGELLMKDYAFFSLHPPIDKGNKQWRIS